VRRVGNYPQHNSLLAHQRANLPLLEGVGRLRGLGLLAVLNSPMGGLYRAPLAIRHLAHREALGIQLIRLILQRGVGLLPRHRALRRIEPSLELLLSLAHPYLSLRLVCSLPHLAQSLT